MNARDAAIDFRVSPEPRLCRVVRDNVAAFARSRGVGEDDVAHFLTALGEALANAMEHGRAAEPVGVEVRVGEDRIVATIQDSGAGFAAALTSVAPPLPNVESERGRGLAIMRRCSDIFAVESSPDKGTAVVVGRYLRKIRSTAEVA